MVVSKRREAKQGDARRAGGDREGRTSVITGHSMPERLNGGTKSAAETTVSLFSWAAEGAGETGTHAWLMVPVGVQRTVD